MRGWNLQQVKEIRAERPYKIDLFEDLNSRYSSPPAPNKQRDLKSTQTMFEKIQSIEPVATQSNVLPTIHARSASRLWTLCGFALLTILLSSGCVQRRMIVRTQPEGAFVTIDRQPVGYSPVSVPFTYYGTRDIQIEKDGFKTVKVQQDVAAPWYGKFPASFVTENFWPREIRDQRVLDFQLEPRTQVNSNQLLDRASTLRSNVQRGTVPLPNR